MLLFFTYSLLLGAKATTIKCPGEQKCWGHQEDMACPCCDDSRGARGAVLCLLLSWSPAMPWARRGRAAAVLGPCLAWHPYPKALGQTTNASGLL